MEDLFIHVMNISITASFLVLAIIFYRLFAKKTPKWVSVLLWGLVGLRLLLPFSIESDMSLVPSKSTVPVTI
ncbi:MAG: peptidase M56, partial [Clostridia bacterium]|nr:peptidase M56 [Clostridia bacterium]